MKYILIVGLIRGCYIVIKTKSNKAIVYIAIVLFASFILYIIKNSIGYVDYNDEQKQQIYLRDRYYTSEIEEIVLRNILVIHFFIRMLFVGRNTEKNVIKKSNSDNN